MSIVHINLTGEQRLLLQVLQISFYCPKAAGRGFVGLLRDTAGVCPCPLDVCTDASLNYLWKGQLVAGIFWSLDAVPHAECREL